MSTEKIPDLNDLMELSIADFEDAVNKVYQPILWKAVLEELARHAADRIAECVYGQFNQEDAEAAIHEAFQNAQNATLAFCPEVQDDEKK